jgi:hypothetical protein
MRILENYSRFSTILFFACYLYFRWCSPKYANLDNAEIDVKESEIESFQMIKQLF